MKSAADNRFNVSGEGCECVAGIEEIIGQQNFFKIKPLINFLIHKDGTEISIMHNFLFYD